MATNPFLPHSHDLNNLTAVYDLTVGRTVYVDELVAAIDHAVDHVAFRTVADFDMSHDDLTGTWGALHDLTAVYGIDWGKPLDGIPQQPNPPF